MLVGVTSPALLTVPVMQSLPCLPCFTLDPGSASLAGLPALDAPWHLALMTSMPERSREDRDVDGDGSGEAVAENRYLFKSMKYLI